MELNYLLVSFALFFVQIFIITNVSLSSDMISNSIFAVLVKFISLTWLHIQTIHNRREEEILCQLHLLLG